jgi:hypothetical protein
LSSSASNAISPKREAFAAGLVPLAPGQHGDHRLAAALGPQVQLGREPALAASQGFNVCPIPDNLVPARAGRVLMGADDGRVYEVQVPIHLALGIRLRLQRN